jgi:hypothetical protein
MRAYMRGKIVSIRCAQALHHPHNREDAHGVAVSRQRVIMRDVHCRGRQVDVGARHQGDARPKTMCDASVYRDRGEKLHLNSDFASRVAPRDPDEDLRSPSPGTILGLYDTEPIKQHRLPNGQNRREWRAQSSAMQSLRTCGHCCSAAAVAAVVMS